jgi:hypothetical protein
MLTPYTDGESPVSRKEPADLQIHGMTGGSTGLINLYTDSAAFLGTPSLSLSYSMLRDGIWRADISEMGPFLKVQVEIYGNFNDLSFHGIGMSHTTRPPHAMNLNLGRIVPPNSGDLAWINQVEIECISAYNLLLDVYKNGILHSTETVAVNPNVRDVYTVQLPRETKGRRLALQLRTTASAGEGFKGFETYMVRVRNAASGNFTELELSQGDQRSDQ